MNERLDSLYWIVSQPECDRATALLIFWKGEPTGYDYEDDEERMGDDVYAVAPMLRYISERFNTTGYARAEIAYDFLEAAGHDADSEYASAIEAGRLRDFQALEERQKDVAEPKVKLHPSMKVLRVSGRKVGGYGDESDFYDRFPEDLDDDDAKPADPAAASPPDHAGSFSGGPPRDAMTDASADASARIRALRYQANADIEDDDGAERAGGLAGWFKGLFRR